MQLTKAAVLKELDNLREMIADMPADIVIRQKRLSDSLYIQFYANDAAVADLSSHILRTPDSRQIVELRIREAVACPASCR